ncbi:hypothetical protein GOP47_0012175 [Adiantum capillus-veneris]|uniref:WRKY domain-containing protein n=1 Tax=Adiantum capillus-veneris TaxID=13818 RepID=A0A9D4ZE80_ADICA|nr:hypothetical protein GOP47_0012175 [Adiantum capillus-veneris]
MEGGFYFSTRRSFGFIDNPPWAARKAAGEAAAKEYYEVGRAALQGESNEAYFVVDHCRGPENKAWTLRDGGRKGVYAGGDGGQQGEIELAAIRERDGYEYGEWVRAVQGSASASSTSTSTSSTSSSNGTSSELACSADDSLPTISGSSWLDLESPDSLSDLQDIDDSWLDSLPPLHYTTAWASSSSASSSVSLAAGGSGTPALLGVLSSAPRALQHLADPRSISALSLLRNPNYPFDGFQDSLYPAPPFDSSPISLDVSPAHGRESSSPPSPQPPANAPSTAATARASPLSSDRKRLKRLDLSEPKYVVLTSNYETVLKDGFKWRKYGQKSVKNNIYPRSYYKCSYEGCYVHKHVERVALDPCLILTTYRGRHTH